MKFPFVSRRAAEKEHGELVAEVRRLNIALTNAGNEASASRHAEIDRVRQVQQFQEKLNATQAMAAEKQREIAMLRTQLAEKDKQIELERSEARVERQKLMDWIAKGVGGGPIFAEVPVPVSMPENEPTPDLKKDRVPTEVEEAIARVGRNARQIVKHIERKKEIDFAAEMNHAGVRRLFQEDRAVAEVEAVVLSEEARRQPA